MNYLPVRPLIKYSSGDGAWIIAQKAEQRKQFKAIVCALKTQSESKITRNSDEQAIHDNKLNTFSKEFIFETCKTVDPQKVAVINADMCHLRPSNDKFTEFTSVYKIKAAANDLNLNVFLSFDFLTDLNLSSNNLHGISINPQDLTNLETLDVSFNELSKGDVLMLGILRKLRKLSLCGNDLNDLPSRMDEPYVDEDGNIWNRFPELEILNLEKNNLSSLDTFSSLGGLSKLKVLRLAHNRLSSVPLLRCSPAYDEEPEENMFQLYPYNGFNDGFEEDPSELYFQSTKMEMRIPSTLLEVDEESLFSKREGKSIKSSRLSSDKDEEEQLGSPKENNDAKDGLENEESNEKDADIKGKDDKIIEHVEVSFDEGIVEEVNKENDEDPQSLNEHIKDKEETLAHEDIPNHDEPFKDKEVFEHQDLNMENHEDISNKPEEEKKDCVENNLELNAAEDDHEEENITEITDDDKEHIEKIGEIEDGIDKEEVSRISDLKTLPDENTKGEKSTRSNEHVDLKSVTFEASEVDVIEGRQKEVIPNTEFHEEKIELERFIVIDEEFREEPSPGIEVEEGQEGTGDPRRLNHFHARPTKRGPLQLIEVNKDFLNVTVTDAIKMIATNSQYQDSLKPFPVLETLDLSHNRIKEEKGIIPVISFINLSLLSIHDNPLTLTRTQKSSFIKELLENAFKIEVRWLPPIKKDKVFTTVSKSKVDVSDTIAMFPKKMGRGDLDFFEPRFDEEENRMELPKLMPVANIISRSKNEEGNKYLQNFEGQILPERKSLSDLERELIDDPEIEVKQKSKIRCIAALKHHLDHPLTYFDRRVNLFQKQELLSSKNKTERKKEAPNCRKRDTIDSILQQQKNRKVQTEISLEKILSPDYYKGNHTMEKEFKVASKALDEMQRKYNYIRHESLKKE